MNNLFDQDRPLTLGAIKLATGVLGLLLFVTGILYVFAGIGAMIDGEILSGLTRIIGTVTILFFMFLLIRLLGEHIAASHRLNDRLTVLGDDMRVRRATTEAEPAPAKPKPAAKAKTKSKASS
jgi:hypothetical protein